LVKIFEKKLEDDAVRAPELEAGAVAEAEAVCICGAIGLYFAKVAESTSVISGFSAV
jgi:hypothetical protein